MGLLLAILIDQHIRAESIFRSIFLFPMALSFVVTGTIWAWILNPNSGINVLISTRRASTAVRYGLLDVALPAAALGRPRLRCASTCCGRA